VKASFTASDAVKEAFTAFRGGRRGVVHMEGVIHRCGRKGWRGERVPVTLIAWKKGVDGHGIRNCFENTVVSVLFGWPTSNLWK
jgi:hypothetical protein